MENRCVVCNEVIPEGRMVCPCCEHSYIKMSMILQDCNATKEEVKFAYDFMEENNDN